jgi:uncharacterized membrane protein
LLAANQRLNNGFLASVLVWGLIQSTPGLRSRIKMFFLLCVVVAGIYGAATISCRILHVPAALRLCTGLILPGERKSQRGPFWMGPFRAD